MLTRLHENELFRRYAVVVCKRRYMVKATAVNFIVLP